MLCGSRRSSRLCASEASAFPLALKSCNGIITATPSYNAITNVDKTKYDRVSFNLKRVMQAVTNTVVQLGYAMPPKDAYIAYDPYINKTYLTNNSGYYQSLSRSGLGNQGYYVTMNLEDMATSFKSNNNGVSEKDTAATYFAFKVIGLDGGDYYAAANYGIGTLKYNKNSKKVSMTITGSGPDYGEIDSSYDGTSSLKFKFQGSAAQAEWSGPFWFWFEQND